VERQQELFLHETGEVSLWEPTITWVAFIIKGGVRRLPQWSRFFVLMTRLSFLF